MYIYKALRARMVQAKKISFRKAKRALIKDYMYMYKKASIIHLSCISMCDTFFMCLKQYTEKLIQPVHNL